MNFLCILRHPRAAVVTHDLVMVAVSWLAAAWIIHRGGSPGISQSLPLLNELLPVLIVQGLVLWSLGLYKGLWRFASFPDLWNIARAALFGTFLIIATLTVLHGAEVRQFVGAVLVYPGILFLTLGLPRMCYRFWKDSHLPAKKSVSGLQRVLVLGAGRSGALLERELCHRGGFEVIGFLDDDRRLQGAQVHGVPVLGAIDRLPKVCREVGADLAIIAMPSATNQQMQAVVEICEKSDVEFRTLPTLNDLGNKATRIDDLKRVVIEAWPASVL
jgi:FlaA1/EpsC-like NDP-sugar epimerase